MKVNKAKTASFDIDPQNGFTPVCPDELPVEGGHQIAPFLNAQAEFARIRVVSQDAHTPHSIWKTDDENPSFSPVDGQNVDIRWNMHCVPGTKGFELIDGLPKPTDYDFIVYKGVAPDMHPYGACYHDLGDTLSTGVIEYLKQNEIETVICGGLATDYCVKLTVLQLLKAGFEVVVNLEACRGIAEETITQALNEMATQGAILIQSATELTNN
ncbi:nicotinamidase [Teredinibacter sp. KSP-S5-2]|uniref:nicotinamidase n=1 Tax=Teredinibacter sp. KSP-S5-2 TaxID=3034506 RepID=UPI002934E423|nr:nicotinamidase [Teredinibacter sp. KSP-S5-2]WNO10861.1 nicotinamidase [Teredinibacter sp. KSP-S5-2]